MFAGGAPRLDACRESVDQACRSLTAPSPEALLDSAGLLEAAVQQLRTVSVAADDARARADVRRLQASVCQAAKLLQNAADYHNGWNRWFGSRIGGYQAGGEPAGVSRPAIVCVNG